MDGITALLPRLIRLFLLLWRKTLLVPCQRSFHFKRKSIFLGSLPHHFSLSPGLQWKPNSRLCWRPITRFQRVGRKKVHTAKDFRISLIFPFFLLPSLHYLCVCLWRLIMNFGLWIADYWNNYRRSRRKRDIIQGFLELNLLKGNNLNCSFVGGVHRRSVFWAT